MDQKESLSISLIILITTSNLQDKVRLLSTWSKKIENLNSLDIRIQIYITEKYTGVITYSSAIMGV